MTNNNHSSNSSSSYSTTLQDIDLYDINLKYLFYNYKKHLFFIQIGLKKETYSWQAKNSDGTPHISYEQDISNSYIGLSLISILTNKILVNANFNYSNNVEIEAFDIHHDSNTFNAQYVTYSDHLKDGVLSEIDLKAYYLLSKNLSFYIGYNSTTYEEVKGYTDINYVGVDITSTTQDNTAGADNESIFYKIGLSYLF